MQGAGMGASVKGLLDLVVADNRFDIPWAELLPRQIEAVNERLSERVGTIKVLANRAETAGAKTIRGLEDLVPLLFAHTSYKSYPETWFTQGKWDRMGKWLGTLTTNHVPGIDTSDVRDVDDWISRLAAAGLYVSASSGTTGKCSFIPSNMEDRTFVKQEIPKGVTWATGIKANREFKMFGLMPIARGIRVDDSRQALVDAFAASDRPFPGDPITVGQITRMVALRRSIADGTARPGDIAAFEATSAQRARAMEDALASTAEVIAASRGEKLLVQGMILTLFQVSEMIRAMGYRGKDFHPDNALITGGGLKGARLPADFREQILDTFNVRPERAYQFYSMQELNSTMPSCNAGRYHAAPWLMLLLLDETGDKLLPVSKGEVEGRAAYFDLSVDGRWGGIITGDKVSVIYGKCACGHEGPSIAREIVRYADLPGGDKISCAGTIDAYIRGAA
jgi:hypothetical protein